MHFSFIKLFFFLIASACFFLSLKATKNRNIYFFCSLKTLHLLYLLIGTKFVAVIHPKNGGRLYQTTKLKLFPVAVAASQNNFSLHLRTIEDNFNSCANVWFFRYLNNLYFQVNQEGANFYQKQMLSLFH